MPVSFFFNDTATTEIYTLSLHDALPICATPARTPCTTRPPGRSSTSAGTSSTARRRPTTASSEPSDPDPSADPDRKSTRLNSSHANISYAVFCLKKKRKQASDDSWYRSL